jgi:3-oxoacyl-[acyl-carrier protein] reductase
LKLFSFPSFFTFEGSTMDLGLKGLKAIVTGGTKGIGRAIAQTLAAEGADVAICARHGDDVDRTVAELSSYGGKVFGGVADVSDAAALQSWVAAAEEALGGIDIVVANVSALAIASDEAGWKSGCEVDMMGTVRLVNAALPALERSSHAAIVTISSVSGREIDFAAGPYGAFKAAIIHYTQGLAHPMRASAYAPTACRPATLILPAACGIRSSWATPNFSKRPWR